MLRDLLRVVLADGLTAAPPPFTRRDVHLPGVPGKALAVVGVRRSGKTTFLWQCLAERVAGGAPRHSQIFVSLEDDRLSGIQASDLAWLLDEYHRLHPHARGQWPLTLYLDEVQVAPGWELFCRRLIDQERVSLFLSGSSAKLLSAEVATSMRGRAMDVLVHPFSLREAMRHAGAEPTSTWDTLGSAARSEIGHHLHRYLTVGGFPEAQGADDRDRIRLLRGYVDLVVLRDVIDRHNIGNPVALRALQRQLLSSPGGSVSVQKCYGALRTTGIPVAKDTVHEYLGYLEDAFLIRLVSIHTASQRRRQANPRKCYPVDPGIIAAYERTGRPQTGHSLETTIMLELERRGWELGYVRTEGGFEVDFVAVRYGDRPLLVQVCAHADDDQTMLREARSLAQAVDVYPDARAILVTLDATAPQQPLPDRLEWMPAARFLLEE